MEIRNLTELSVAEIAQTFNAAFVDYKIKFDFTEETMAAKIKSENIRLQYCPAAFDEGKLVGFILTATDTFDKAPVVYNAGTGVLPEYRKQGIAKQLYQHLIATLEQYNYKQHVLEVFDDNHKAIAVYEATGFKEKRKMLCYKGSVALTNPAAYNVMHVAIDPDLFRTFWDVQPSWQNNLPSILRNIDDHKVIGVKNNGEVVAYAIYVRKTGRIKQLAVRHDKRGKGLGTALLKHVVDDIEPQEAVITCVEYNSTIDRFLKNHGLHPFIDMTEMVKFV